MKLPSSLTCDRELLPRASIVDQYHLNPRAVRCASCPRSAPVRIAGRGLPLGKGDSGVSPPPHLKGRNDPFLPPHHSQLEEDSGVSFRFFELPP